MIPVLGSAKAQMTNGGIQQDFTDSEALMIKSEVELDHGDHLIEND